MCIKTNRLNERCRIVLLFFSFVVFFQFSKMDFSWYSRGESIVFNLGIMAIIHSDDSTTRLRLVLEFSSS
jgi:hypothetical protein